MPRPLPPSPFLCSRVSPCSASLLTSRRARFSCFSFFFVLLCFFVFAFCVFTRISAAPDVNEKCELEWRRQWEEVFGDGGGTHV